MTTNIEVCSGLLLGRSSLPAHHAYSQYAILTNECVAGHYLDAVRALFPAERTQVIVLADGEHTKSLEQYQAITNQLIDHQFDRDSCLITLGGGVITDLGGFVAATYLRGIHCIHIPTSLLAQVDASIGNKTAINHPRAKNLLGAFYQADAIWVDPDCLQTLSPRQFNNGMAEVIKAGCIADSAFIDWLISQHHNIQQRDTATLCTLVETAISIKSDLVAQDPTEQHQRRLLNFGHTLGHAIEAEGNYQSLLHGEAVSIGMAYSLKLSQHRGHLSANEVKKIHSLLQSWSLPTALPSQMTLEPLKYRMQLDKKMSHGQIKVILLVSLGKATICPLSLDDFISELGRN